MPQTLDQYWSTLVNYVAQWPKNPFFFFPERYLSGALASNEMILQHHQHQQHQHQQLHQVPLGQVPKQLTSQNGLYSI